ARERHRGSRDADRMFSCGSGDACPSILQRGGERPIIDLDAARRTLAPEAVRPGGALGQYRFDDISVDVASFRVERGGRAVPLEPKAFDLLVLLLERQGRLVTKQEILDSVWRQTAVTDNALTRIVANLRKALGDDARDSKYIETIPTRGYRWLLPVQLDGTEPAWSPVERSPKRRVVWLSAAVVA